LEGTYFAAAHADSPYERDTVRFVITHWKSLVWFVRYVRLMLYFLCRSKFLLLGCFRDLELDLILRSAGGEEERRQKAERELLILFF
jgi:hypothetical protein